jgi:hypothetical protein
MGTKFKRSRLWVDSGFQLRLLIRMGFYLLLYIGLVLFIDLVFELMASFGNNLTSQGPHGNHLEVLERQKYLLLALVMALPIIFYDLLKFSHRVAGPLYRCRKLMEQMAEGKPVPEFKARKHDLMRELFEAFNTLINEWNSRTSGGVNSHPCGSNTGELMTGEKASSRQNTAVAVP